MCVCVSIIWCCLCRCSTCKTCSIDSNSLHGFILVTWSFATVFGQRVTCRFPSLGEMFYLKSDEEHNILKRIYNSLLYMHMHCKCIDSESWQESISPATRSNQATRFHGIVSSWLPSTKFGVICFEWCVFSTSKDPSTSLHFEKHVLMVSTKKFLGDALTPQWFCRIHP